MKTAWIVALLLCAGMALAEELPQELQHLQPLLENEAQLTEAIRAFDKAQTDLAKAEIKAAEEAKEAAVAQSKMAAAKGRFDLVRKAYEIGLGRFPNSARLHNYLGELLYDFLDEQNAAVKEWETALSLDANHGNAHNNLGLHFFHNGDYRMGLHHMDEALRIDAKNPDYLYNMAQLYLVHWPQIQDLRGWSAKKVYRKAMDYSRLAAKYQPNDYDLVVDYAVNFFAGERCEVKVSWKKAAKAWEAARAQARNDTERFYTWLNEARVWLRAGNKEKAAQCLRPALAIHPESTVAQGLLKNIEDESKEKK